MGFKSIFCVTAGSCAEYNGALKNSGWQSPDATDGVWTREVSGADEKAAFRTAATELNEIARQHNAQVDFILQVGGIQVKARFPMNDSGLSVWIGKFGG